MGIVPAASLRWLVEVRPREVMADSALRSAVQLLVPDARFETFAARHGGVDLRGAEELAIAGYPETILALARAPIEPSRVLAAFEARALTVEGRTSSHGVMRAWGSLGRQTGQTGQAGQAGQAEQIAVFERQGVGIERGRAGPLRAAIYFAEQRLVRAKPALAAEPLASSAADLGAAPLRAFAPGPFEGEWAGGLGGLLAATTAVGGAAWPGAASAAGDASAASPLDPSGPGLRIAVVLGGAWGADAQAAGNRLRAEYEAVAHDAFGRLLGLDHPLAGPEVTRTPSGGLRLEVTVDPSVLARGLYEVTTATAAEVMAY